VPPNPIDAQTQLVGLIGWPVEHSLSPAMHNAAFRYLGLNWRYVPLPVSPGQVQAAVRGLDAMGFRGANVTVPHKQAALQALQATPSHRGEASVAPDAQALGAINTIVVSRSEEEDDQTTLSGHNTDVAGFIGALEAGGFRPAGSSTVIVGAGGAARAVVYGLALAGAKEIVVLNRTPARAQALVSDLRRALPDPSPSTLQALSLTQDRLLDAAHAAKLLVNATPVGMWPRVDRSIWPEGVPMPPHLTVFDLVYNPLETKLQAQAHASDAQTLDGLGMLVRQGALALELWTGQDAPIAVMRTACQRTLHPSPRP
jgi:shikimate dehydrogenase